jgi:small subunit ribosomal protein S21
LHHWYYSDRLADNKIEGGVLEMPTIEVIFRKGENVEKALRRLKKRLDRESVLQDAKTKRYYEKPSEKKRRKGKIAKFTNYLRSRKDKE